MPAILSDIVANKKEELKVRKQQRELAALKAVVKPGDNGFARALKPDAARHAQDTVRLICELKPKSPSAGVLKAAPDISKILNAYDKYASAISVLTDDKYFGGSLKLLSEISERSRLPTLCKDFIIDPYQCYEAREAGAEAILLIVKILNDEELHNLHDVSARLNMTPVVEVQTEEELNRALVVIPEVILINNRDLSTFEISFDTTKHLAPLIPQEVIRISASGVAETQDIDELLPYCSNFLIGSSLMIADDLEAKLAELMAVHANRSHLQNAQK